MTRQLFAAAVFLLVPAPGFAQDLATPVSATAPPAGRSAAQELRAATVEINKAVASIQECFAQEAWLKNDLAKKKAALTTEFKGAIPEVFSDLLWQKTQRLNAQYARCSQQHEEVGKMFTALYERYRGIGPMNATLKKQKVDLDALNTRFLKLVPTAKPAPQRRPARSGE